MDEKRLRTLLADVKRGRLSIDQAAEKLKDLPFHDLGFACVDHHRTLRTGHPEVVFGQGKTVDQVLEIVASLIEAGDDVLVTRASEAQASALTARHRSARHHAPARTVTIHRKRRRPTKTGTVVVISAGTGDIPVAEEAAVTADFFGARVERRYDVGVAGIHRILPHRKLFQEAAALVVVAGMEGALASVVAGLTGKPVIAVPTSIGYGASFGGIAALLGMLNSCATGVVVVNIDNGFGAGAAAAMIAKGNRHA